jgi:adenylate cyclase
VGDAVLAIFPLSAGRREACRSALAAATAALDALCRLQAPPGVRAMPEISIGVALHLGSVLYGNIGARGRLDFTVISSAVNEACRLESLCKDLGTPLTLSQAFVDALGERALKGVAAPLRVFTLKRFVGDGV